MENSLLDIFDEILPKTLYYSTGCFVKFWSNLKNPNSIGISSNALLRIKEHKYMYIDNKTIICYNVHANNVLVNSPILT